MDTMERMPYAVRNAVFRRLTDITTLAGMTREDQAKYEHALKAYRDNLAVRRYQEEEDRRRREEQLEMEEEYRALEDARMRIIEDSRRMREEKARAEDERTKAEEEKARVEEEVKRLEQDLENKTVEAQPRDGLTGTQKGCAEGIEAVAITMIANGMDANLVSLYTGVPAEQVQVLTENVQK